jgi:hypothetical protein
MFMKRLSKRVIIAVLVFFFGVAAVAYWLYREETQKDPDIVSISRFDSMIFKGVGRATGIDQLTSLAGLPELRKVRLRKGDIEARVWRGFGLGLLEGVLIKRVGGEWSGLHVSETIDQHGDVQAAEVNQLKTPKLGWESFWGKLVDKGILKLPLTPENECETKYIDGTLYVVEINQNGTYRNYQNLEGADECRESKQMTEIGEIIGLEFDSGQEKCKRFEWFACMTSRKADSLPSP